MSGRRSGAPQGGRSCVARSSHGPTSAQGCRCPRMPTILPCSTRSCASCKSPCTVTVAGSVSPPIRCVRSPMRPLSPGRISESNPERAGSCSIGDRGRADSCGSGRRLSRARRAPAVGSRAPGSSIACRSVTPGKARRASTPRPRSTPRLAGAGNPAGRLVCDRWRLSHVRRWDQFEIDQRARPSHLDHSPAARPIGSKSCAHPLFRHSQIVHQPDSCTGVQRRGQPGQCGVVGHSPHTDPDTISFDHDGAGGYVALHTRRSGGRPGSLPAAAGSIA